MKPRHTWQSAQQGITLIEALIALIILALGVLGLASVQTRMMVETRTTNSRATAVRLIADLGERIRINSAGARPPASGTSPYADQNDSFQLPSADTPTPDCADPALINNPCTAAQQAVYDRWFWKTEVAQSLPNGVASVTQITPQQLRIIVAWQFNENTDFTLAGNTSTALKLSGELQITDTSSQNICNPSSNSFICHVDFIEIPN